MTSRHNILLIVFLFSFFGLSAQSTLVRGVVSDAATGETLIGVNVIYAPGKGTVSDINGEYSLDLPYGTYQLSFSYVGYVNKTIDVELRKPYYSQNVAMETVTLTEVEVIGDIARERATPVAFTNVLPAKLEEELASRDIPLVLNNTPGVYATPEGGGDGDAQITIRGFDSRNVGALLDGIPVNDMENGHVYWSNWFGLDVVTRTIQVQRGLGASKLALPSVGGTINILTKGLEDREEHKFKYEISSEGRFRASIGYNSGKMKNGWGITLAAAYKKGDGWVDETWSEAGFYYLKVDKQFGKHLLSASVMGAPQEHAQRSYKRAIATYSKSYAEDLGIEDFPHEKILDKGIQYNQHWGYISRNRYDENAPLTRLNERVNMYHKPLFSLRDFWSVNDKLYISNVAYLSIGSGGGTVVRPSSPSFSDYNEDGQINWQKYYQANQSPFTINTDYADSSQHMASTFLARQTNNHFWLGLLSTVNYQINSDLSFSGGVDLRTYKGEHYEMIWDLLGADYVVETTGQNAHKVLREGDKYNYYNDGLVRWGGLFSQLEYTTGSLSAFINITAANSFYKRIDYFAYAPGNQESDWKAVPGYTAKAGANYNLSEKSNVFINLGILSKSRGFSYIFDGYTNEFREDIENEEVLALEGGYNFRSSLFSINLNAYLTQWNNRSSPSFRRIIDGEDAIGYIDGLDAFHKGVELDFVYRVNRQLELQGLMSLGDWRYNVEADIEYYDQNTQELLQIDHFDATGVHVSGSAQTQIGGSLRYQPFKGFYLKAQLIHFDRYFAQFDPSSLGDADLLDENGEPRDSWKVPAYSLLDIHSGYSFRVNDLQCRFNLSVLNALDEVYISSAQNNDAYINPSFSDFDAKSASVFFGLGRRFNISMTLTF